MKRLTGLLFLAFLTLQSSAQQGAKEQKQKFQRVQAAKVDYLTERLALTAEQAERFWPVYHQYEAEIRLINKEGRQARRAGRTTDMTDAEIKRSLDEMRQWQEARIAAQRKYEPQFLRVVSARQVADLYTAEREFNALLLKRLRDARQTVEHRKHSGRRAP